MTRSAARLILAALLAAFAAPDPASAAAAAVTLLDSNADEAGTAPRRVLSPHEQLAYRGVGRLDFGTGFCTATLLTDTQAVTAAHCLFDSAGERRGDTELWFRAGLNGDTAQAVRQVRRSAVHPDYVYNGKRATLDEIASDVAILELDQPLLTTEFPNYLPGDLPRSGGAVALLSYGSGRDRVLSLQAPCHVEGRSGPVAVLDCEVAPGASGSPVLVRDGKDLRLAGIIAARGVSGRSYASLTSVTLPKLRLALEERTPGRRSASPGGSLADMSAAGGTAFKAAKPPAE